MRENICDRRDTELCDQVVTSFFFLDQHHIWCPKLSDLFSVYHREPQKDASTNSGLQVWNTSSPVTEQAWRRLCHLGICNCILGIFIDWWWNCRVGVSQEWTVAEHDSVSTALSQVPFQVLEQCQGTEQRPLSSLSRSPPPLFFFCLLNFLGIFPYYCASGSHLTVFGEPFAGLGFDPGWLDSCKANDLSALLSATSLALCYLYIRSCVQSG